MTQKELQKAVEKIAARYSDLNTKYIKQIAEQIKAIGELNAKSLNQIAEMVRMNAGISEIIIELQRLTELTKKDVKDIMERVAEDEIMDARHLPYYADKTGLPEDQITPALAKQYIGSDTLERLRRSTLAMAAQTDDRLDNLSNTTAISEPYKAAIDRAVLAAHENVTSYTEAMRDTVREIGSAGMQVRYESGYHRRLDTAVRQNILDATGQLAQTAAIMVGEALEYNAFEISAHAMSAPDHEPVQGRVFLVDEFYKLQQAKPSKDIDGHEFEAIRRPIKEWNCGHFAYPFDTRYSTRKYTEEQLKKFKDDNEKGCTIGDRKYTLYEASQIMRRIETQIRREKDTAVAAQAAGDEQLRIDCQLRINHLSGLYKQVTDASGLTPRRERMTVEGFRRAKVPENAEKGLTSGAESGKINIKVDEFVPCLKDAKTGEILPTEVAKIPHSRLKEFTELGGWGIDWKDRPKNEYTLGVFLKDDTNPQGLISLRRDSQGVYMSFASTAPHNNKDLTGGTQKYIGVGGHLFAAAIEESVKAGTGGCVYGFAVNKEVLAHYIKEFGAVHIPIEHPFQFMIADEAAQRVVDIYNYERRR